MKNATNYQGENKKPGNSRVFNGIRVWKSLVNRYSKTYLNIGFASKVASGFSGF